MGAAVPVLSPLPHMDTAWIGAASALAGVAVTSAVDAWRARTSFRREKAWALFDDKRRRLEALYQALEEVRESYGLLYGHMWLETSAKEFSVARERSGPIPWARLRMLVNLYAPDLRYRLELVERMGAELGHAIASAMIAQEHHDAATHSVLLASGQDAMVKLTAAVDLMRDEIVRQSRALGGEAEHMAGRTDGTAPRGARRRRLQEVFSRLRHNAISRMRAVARLGTKAPTAMD